jgi:hypothetical protein
MRVRSKLADVEFRFGSIERKDNELIINSHPDQTMKSRVYVSPADVLTVLGRIVSTPGAWVFLLGLPFFYWRSEKRKVQSGK